MSGSVTGQTVELFKRHHGEGESRADWKKSNPEFGKMADVTFSWSSLRRYQHTSIEFVKWAHDKHGIKQIRDVTTAMVVAYIDERRARNLSPRTIATDITGLRRFGMYLVLEGWHKQSCVPNDLSEPHGSNPRYSYAPEHADQVIDSVAKHDPLAADVLRWQLACGLRISEAVRLRLDKLDFERGTLETKGKGGKLRKLKVPDRALLERLDRTRRFPLLRGNATSQTRHIEDLVAEACEALNITPAGTHGLRAGAAQRTLDEQTESGVDERTARKNVAQLLGHNRTSVTRSYAP